MQNGFWEKKERVIYRFLNRALWIISCVTIFCVFGLNMIYTSEVAYSKEEHVSIPYAGISSILMLALILILVVFLAQFQNRLEKINEKRLFLSLTVVYVLAACYFIFNVDTKLRADAEYVFLAAQNILKGDYSDLKKGAYLYRFPYQTGIVFYDSLILMLGGNTAANFVLNLLFILGINYTYYRMADKIFENKVVSVLTILISFLFLPQFFFILFAYGLIPGFFFLSTAFYHGICFAKSKSKKNLLVMVAASAIAVVMKQNNLIGVLAIIIYLILETLRSEQKGILLAAIVLLAASLVLPGKWMVSYYENKTGAELNQGTPSVLWIAMGTDIDNEAGSGGWWDGSNYTLYDEADHNSELAKQMGTEKLKQNLLKIQERPMDAIRFLKNKITSQWCDPLYQSIWSGPLKDSGQNVYSPVLESFYTGGTAENMAAMFSKFISLTIVLGMLLYLLMFAKAGKGWEVSLLFCIGGFLFHIIWEGKSQYIYPYIFAQIPFAACAVYKTAALVRTKMKKHP